MQIKSKKMMKIMFNIKIPSKMMRIIKKKKMIIMMKILKNDLFIFLFFFGLEVLTNNIKYIK